MSKSSINVVMKMEFPKERLSRLSRMLRISTVRNLVHQRRITRDEALEILKGRLNPEDETSVVDDTVLLDLSYEDLVMHFIVGQPFITKGS